MTETTRTNLNPHETPDNPQWNFIRQVLIVLALIALFALVSVWLWYGADVILLIFAGLLLGIFLRSLSGLLSRHTTLSNNWALTFVLVLIVGLITLGVWLLAPSIERQFYELSDQLPAIYERAREQLSQYPLGRSIVEKMPSAQQFVLGRQSANVFGRVTGMFSTALDIVVNILIVLMTAVYFAFTLSSYKEGAIKLVPKKSEKRAREIISSVHYTLKNFLLGISASMTINGILTFSGLWLLGIPFAIPLGIIAGLMSFIPNIGPIIAGVPAVLIALSQSPVTALYVLILYLAVQNLDGLLITPLIQKKAVSIPPVMIIAAQLLMAVMFGFLGLLLAVPFVAVIAVLVRMIYIEDILDRKIEIKGEKNVES